VDAPGYAAALAALPLVALGFAVFRTRLGLGAAAWLVATLAAALALAVFDLDLRTLALGAAKGAWTGVWILLFVVPALLLYEVADRGGALERLAGELGVVAPTPARRVLLLGWVFPSFLQGVAGFGVPVVVAAPMLVRLGLAPVVAVATCLVGYHWSVTFGSMGSSFFVAAGTAQLTVAETATFALHASILLAVAAIATGLVLLRRVEGGGEAVRAALAVGLAMGATLVAVVALQPALGSTAAGLAGLVAAWLVLPRAGDRPALRPLLRAAAPYIFLTGLVATVFGVPALRELAGRLPELAPAFPETTAAFGHVNPAIAEHQPLRPLLHPGPYLLATSAFAVLWVRRLGWWPGGGTGRRIVGAWARRSRSTVLSLLGLTILSAVMVEAGMLSAMASALARGLGLAYVPLAPIVGAAGTALTGSTTASNALLAPLQADAARELQLAVTTLLTAQTAGGNLGNAVTPVNALIAGAAAGAAGQEGAILRRAARDLAPVVALVVAGVALLAVFA
jgi:lactate permease